MRNIIVLMAILIAGATYAQQPAKVTKKFYPAPSIDINTPAFKNGKAKGVTSYKRMMKYINGLASQHPNLFRVEFIGQTQRGAKIPVVYVSGPKGPEKVKVMYSARVHGDEPGSTEGMLYLMERLAVDPAMQQLLTRIDLAILPMVNIDGGKFLNRVTANGGDLNRDMSKLAHKESQVYRAFFNQFAPAVAIDFHEYQPLRNDYWNLAKESFNMACPYDAMFLYSSNLSVAPSIRSITKNLFVENAIKSYDANRFTHHDYYSSDMTPRGVQVNVGGASARSTTNAFALSNTISVLMEIRGVRLGNETLKRRIQATYLAAESYLRTTYDNVAAVNTAIAEANASQHDVVVVQRPKKVDNYVLPFIDVERATIKDIPVLASLTAEATPVLVRQRPQAYYLSASEARAAEKLRQLGVEVKPLAAAETLEVEAYQVASVKESTSGTDGVMTISAKTGVVRQTITLPAGSFRVDMNQHNANLASLMLEPEAPNGFVYFRIVEAQSGATLPIYRLVK